MNRHCLKPWENLPLVGVGEKLNQALHPGLEPPFLLSDECCEQRTVEQRQIASLSSLLFQRVGFDNMEFTV